MSILPEELIQRIIAEFPGKEYVIRQAAQKDVLLPIMNLIGQGITNPDFGQDIANFKDGRYKKVHPEVRRARLENLQRDVCNTFF